MTGTTSQSETSRFSSSRISPRGRDLISLGLIATLVLVALPGLYRYQGPPMEEGFMLAFPEQLLKGNLPHRDFLHLYGPGALWVLAAVYKIFGVTLEVERTVGLFQHLGMTYGIFFLLRSFGRRIATAAAMVSFVILIGPAGLSAMAWNGALALGVCSLAVGASASVATGRRAQVLSGLSGVLAGAALLYRPDLILAIGLGCGAMFLRQPKDRRLPMLIGAIATTALYIPHMLISGVGDSFNGMFIEPVFKLRAGRTLPAPPSWNSIDGFLQRVGVLRTTGWPLPMMSQAHQVYIWFWLVPLSIGVVVFAAWKLRRSQNESRWTTALWPASLFCLALVTQAVQRPDSTHLAWVSGVSFPLLIPAVYVLSRQYLPKLSAPRVRLAAIGLPVVVLVAVIPFYPLRTYADLVGQSFGFNRFGFPVERDGRRFYLGDEGTARSAQEVTDSLAKLSQPGQSLIVGPGDMSRANYSDSFFYYLFPDLEAGTRYIEMDPGLADTENSGLADEVSNADWLILSDVWSGWVEPNSSARSRSHAPNRVIRDEFCVVTSAGLFRLMERCA